MPAKKPPVSRTPNKPFFGFKVDGKTPRTILDAIMGSMAKDLSAPPHQKELLKAIRTLLSARGKRKQYQLIARLTEAERVAIAVDIIKGLKKPTSIQLIEAPLHTAKGRTGYWNSGIS
ncbi:MAG: hypothetical protein COY40_00455 [Alphaproteobacteria bacterium CG_4_10_14_0_8_um_filter_53_9]|nr:MAG: hypothetical protein COY40_00455 [Alphaproteobacteria bacterium CG_4_10_14_0_8_um_filter_53_9]